MSWVHVSALCVCFSVRIGVSWSREGVDITGCVCCSLRRGAEFLAVWDLRVLSDGSRCGRCIEPGRRSSRNRRRLSMVGGRGALAGFPARQEDLSRWLGVVLLDRRCSGASCLVLCGLGRTGCGRRAAILTALSPSVEGRRRRDSRRLLCRRVVACCKGHGHWPRAREIGKVSLQLLRRVMVRRVC